MAHPCEIFKYHTEGASNAETIQHDLSIVLTTSCTSNQVSSCISRRVYRGGCSTCILLKSLSPAQPRKTWHLSFSSCNFRTRHKFCEDRSCSTPTGEVPTIHVFARHCVQNIHRVKSPPSLESPLGHGEIGEVQAQVVGHIHDLFEEIIRDTSDKPHSDLVRFVFHSRECAEPTSYCVSYLLFHPKTSRSSGRMQLHGNDSRRHYTL